MTFENAEHVGDFRGRKEMMSLKFLKEIETDQESNESSSDDFDYYSPKSVVVKMMEVSVNVSRRVKVVHNPILRIRSEDSLIGQDVGEGLINKFGNDCVDVTLFSRPASPLSLQK